jgi:hypothetical protein
VNRLRFIHAPLYCLLLESKRGTIVGDLNPKHTGRPDYSINIASVQSLTRNQYLKVLVLHARVPEALQESPHTPGLPALGCFHFCFIERCAHNRYISFESIRLWFDLSNGSTIIKVSATIIHRRSTTIFALPAHRFLKSPNVKQDRQGTYNVTMRRVSVTIVPVGKQ